MKYREIGKTNLSASILGLGCMRFPMIESQIDIPQSVEMIRYAIDHGVNYIDTAYPYHDGQSEIIVGEALKDGYREKAILVTKSPSWLIQTEEDFGKYLDEQLNKLQTSSGDIYLLHALDQDRWENYKRTDVFKAIEKAKTDGKIKHIGFSFHDEYPVFETIIDEYPWDVCMLQLNYMDMEEQAGYKGLKYAESKEIPVIVMEPLKGGMLSSPSEDIQAIWDAYTDFRSPVEWAFRYLANEENVKVILSGMSSMEHLMMNIELTDRLTVNNMDDEALAIVDRVKTAYQEKIQVPCTQCKYCIPCPQGVEIPRVFTMYNRAHVFNTHELIKKQYNSMLTKEAKASNCVACGICETKCPQKIEIIKHLSEIVRVFE